MDSGKLRSKLGRRARYEFLRAFSKAPFYVWLYPARWGLAVSDLKDGSGSEVATGEHYLTAIPHAGAGIGHQLANVLAGYRIAEKLALGFAPTPLASPTWERFFGFGADMPSVPALRASGYRIVRLPLFDAADADQVQRIRRIVAAHATTPTVFCLEQDQFETNLDKSASWFRRQFQNVHPTPDQPRSETGQRLTVALHIRRGDIGMSQDQTNPNLAMRWNSDAYFLNLIDTLTESRFGDRMTFDIYSQGEASGFAAFVARPNVTLHLDTDLAGTFLDLTRADVLVTSRSSLSYKAALLNRGLKIVPDAFWHTYPDTPDWLVGSEPDGVPTAILNDRLEQLLAVGEPA